MQDSPNEKMTLRQALARKWQIPLFILSLCLFLAVLITLRPVQVEPTFEERFADLTSYADQGRYQLFYQTAEQLRQDASDDHQLGLVHELAAQTRVRQLRQLHQFDLDPYLDRAASSSYQHIINDYTEALRRNDLADQPDLKARACRDLALAHWCLNQPDRALAVIDHAVALDSQLAPELRRMAVRMLLAARPKDYLDRAMSHLDSFLALPAATDDDRAWCVVRQAEIMIAQGRENEALSLLSQDEQSLRQSAHAIEVEFLKGSALHHSGQTDQADLVLRDLIQRIPDRGDIYARTALELGKINLQQFRDDEAARFFRLVTDSQTGKDWEAAARLGLAECAALQIRYDQAVALYQQTADLLQKKPFNRSLTNEQLQQSLALLAHRLALLKKYPQALAFLEIEQQIAPENDVDAAHRFARMHDRLAQQLRQLTDLSESQTKSVEPTENEKLWLQQQRPPPVNSKGCVSP